MQKYALRTLVVCLALVFCATASQAALSTAQYKCQNTAAKQSRKLFKKIFGALSKCHNDISKGKLAPGTDCTIEPDTLGKINDSKTKFEEQVKDQCDDGLIASLDFGESCFDVMTEDDLVACLITEHETSARSMIDIAYADIGARCVGAPNDGLPCLVDLDCSPGTCEPLDAEQRKCQKLFAKTVGKYAGKRMGALQSCNKKIGKDKLPPDTKCVTEESEKLAKTLEKSMAKIALSCPQPVADTLEFGGLCQGRSDPASLGACALCLDDREADDLIGVQYGASPLGADAGLKLITNSADCVGGPMSRCRVGDYLLSNDQVRVVVQSPQRNLFSIGQFGGQIIDADLVRTSGPDRDSFEEWSVSLNIENTAHYTSLSIINDGSDGGPAILRATGVDDLLDFLNPSSVIAGFGFPFPASADDFDLPVTIMTDYILEPGTNYVRVETTVQNEDPGDDYPIFFGEFINASGQIEFFQPGYGFGEPLVATRCPITAENQCNFLAWSGEESADGVSYGYVHLVPGSSTFTTSGVTVPQLGVEVVLALIGAATPPFTLEPMGDDGDSLTFTRYFVVGDGSVSSITDTRNQISCLATGTLEGTVTVNGSPAAGADIAVLGNLADGPGLSAMTRNVVTHTRTDANGQYSLTLPPGNYSVVANRDGHPYEGGGSSPVSHPVVIAALATVQQNVAIPLTGALRVQVTDEGPNPIAAKASIVGFDPSPDPLNSQSVFGIVNNTTAVFGERSEDGVPFGLAKVVFIDPSGDSGDITIEPASYRVTVSHGPEYSITNTDVTVSASPAPTLLVPTQIGRVLDTTGFVSADFHVHSIASPDSEVANVDRVKTMLAEGLDFFTPTDHDFLADFSSAVTDAGGDGLISIAQGQEITTFDYGHFNAWPLTVDPLQVNGGAVDHGGAAPDGLDFPSQNNFSEAPVDIIALAKNMPQPGAGTVQINHIHSHFGLDGGSGLAIDTGVEPPQSGVPAVARRLNPLTPNFFTDTFDALEIWIGDSRGQMSDNFLGQAPTGRGGNIGDWFNLINQGIVRTGIADSDTHNRIINVAGFPRSMVAAPSDDASAVDSTLLSTNVNAGRTLGTNAPMVYVTAFAASTGQSGGLDLGRCTGVVDCTDIDDCAPCTDDAQCAVGETCTTLPTTIETNDTNVEIRVNVQSPEWAEFDRIEFYINSATTKRFVNALQTGAGPINLKRYSVTPDVVHNAGSEFTVNSVPVNGSNRLEAETLLTLTGLTEDSWVVVLVKGTDGVSKPLFPVIPNSLKQTGNSTLANLNDGNLNEDGITALAFTNPIFIDVDGLPWTAPGVQVTNP